VPRRVLLVGVLCSVFASGCAPSPFSAPREVSGYRAVYRVEERTPGSVEVRTEIREVRRPFDGRFEVLAGPPPGARVRSGTVVNRVYQWAIADAGVLRVGFRRAPGGAVGDVSYTALRDGAASGEAFAVGRGGALGRRCTWFAYADPTGPLHRPTDDSRVESCVDASGILLRQVWTIRSTVVRLIEATSVTTRAPDRDRFLADRKPKQPSSEDLDPETLIASAVVVDDDADPGRLAVGIDAPPSFEVRRDAVVAESGGGQGQVPSQAFVQAFVRDGELVVVERSTSPNLRPTWGISEGTKVRLGELGEGRLVYLADRVELRLIGTRGYARVRAPSRAIALLFGRRLRAA
jgi:hypothetical protein